MKRGSTSSLRATGLVGVLLLVLGLLTACGGSEGATDTAAAAQRFAAAEKTLQQTSGLKLTLATDKLPDGVNGVLSASGVNTDAPAFKGEIKGSQNNLSVTIPVVAVGGKVYVKFGAWQAVDPGEFNAPDPSTFLGGKAGLSSILSTATGVSAGKKKRDGKDIVTDYEATVPGATIATILPTAVSTKDFRAVFTLDDADRLIAADLTGEFYPGTAPVTYRLTLSSYGTTASIKAPV